MPLMTASNPDDPAAAEIAITIVDDWQGMGLGRILLHRLLAMMSERRIPWAEGRLQADNRRMRRLLESFVPAGGFERDGDTLTFRFAVPRLGDPLMAQLARNAAAVAHLFKCMAEGGVLLPLALAPLLVGMGFAPLRVAALCLIMDSVPVTFGAVGQGLENRFGQLFRISGLTRIDDQFFNFSYSFPYL